MGKEQKAVCVIAWPAGHSRSPLIHNYWIKQHKLDAEYRREAVPPDKFAEFVGHLYGKAISVRISRCRIKSPRWHYRSRTNGRARSVRPTRFGTSDDTLRSTNTDVEGFLANLDVAAPGWDRGLETAVVLGAGGGARAVVFALLQREVGRVYVINRTRDRAQVLKKKFGARVHLAGWNETTGLLGGAGILVNTTHIGDGRAAAAGDQFALPGLACRGRYCLCAAGDGTAGVGARAGPTNGGWPRHVAASGGPGISSFGSAYQP